MEQIKDLNVSFERVCVPELIQILFFCLLGELKSDSHYLIAPSVEITYQLYYIFIIILISSLSFFQQGVEELMDGDIICFQRYAGVGIKWNNGKILLFNCKIFNITTIASCLDLNLIC